jgi:uncharacterized membrane protein
VKKLNQMIPVNSSAFVVLVKRVAEDKVLTEIEPSKPRAEKVTL